jgi:hypothetical protein
LIEAVELTLWILGGSRGRYRHKGLRNEGMPLCVQSQSVWSFDVWSESEGETVEFRLIYSGRLPAASGSDTRSLDKHRIRKFFHSQLKELWNIQSPMSEWVTRIVPAGNSPTGQECSLLDSIAQNYTRCGFRFVPLVTEGHALCCELDILFLRRDAPGKIIHSGGDIDNRIKVLFDALRMPDNCAELGTSKPSPDEDPMFVLLQSDALITKVSVTTDRLLTALGDDEHHNDVQLVIAVKVKVVKVSPHLSNLQFLD